MTQILGQTQFKGPSNGWIWPDKPTPGTQPTSEGLVLSASPDEAVTVPGPGVHTRNGDSIELRFRLLRDGEGRLEFGFDADGHEPVAVVLDFGEDTISLSTSDFTMPQPVATVPCSVEVDASHVLLIEKTEGGGRLIKNVNVTVYLDGEKLISLADLNMLPEMGVQIEAKGAQVLVEEFVHRGEPSGIPEFLHLGGWQMLNIDSIEANLDSICRGLRLAAEQGVELLVTPETSLTGLFPISPGTREPAPIAEAETKLKRFIRDLTDAPYLVVGLPVWESVPGHNLERTRYNVSRVYDPDGEILSTHKKVHSAEEEFQHGYCLNEFDVNGVPCSMHICHDHRYPELWTLPVMFGTRLVLHPSNGGKFTGSIDALEEVAKSHTTSSHAFYIHVNGGGASYIVGPQRNGKLFGVSSECRRDNAAFPIVGEPEEGLFHARIRVHDAFGYWPVRSFRASEAVAEAYLSLYTTLGGRRAP